MSLSRRDSDVSMLADLRRRVGWLEKRTAPAGAKKLDDLSDVTIRDPASNEVVTYNGAQWVNLPSVAGDAATSLALGEWTDDGIFDEVTPFTFSQSITVSANSYQLVIVDATVSGISDTALPVDGDPVNGIVTAPTPWKLTIVDDTGAPGVVVGQNSIGGGYCQVSMWVHNDTDDAASHSIYAVTNAVSGSYEFDATVEITIRSVFSLAAV